MAELSFLCEELQKRLLSLQSGEEVERVQREVREAFGLAERQDELLEEASTKLELVKDESRSALPAPILALRFLFLS